MAKYVGAIKNRINIYVQHSTLHEQKPVVEQAVCCGSFRADVDGRLVHRPSRCVKIMKYLPLLIVF
jgi:hypothetical protein